MIDLAAIAPETIRARGEYATVRSAHEEAKKKLSILCGQFGHIAPQVLRYMQPVDGDSPDMSAVLGLLSLGRETLDKMAECVSEIEVLALQRVALKSPAWGKR